MTSRRVPEGVVRALASGAAPKDGELIVRSLEGWIFKTIEEATEGKELDIIVDVPAKGARVYRSSDQNITQSVETVIQWTDEDYDHGGFVDLVSQNTRITVPTGEDGIYMINSIITISDFENDISDGEVRHHLSLKKNGTEEVKFIQNQYAAIGSPHEMGMQLTANLSLVAGDYIEIAKFDESPTPTVKGSKAQTFMSAIKLGSVGA